MALVARARPRVARRRRPRVTPAEAKSGPSALPRAACGPGRGVAPATHHSHIQSSASLGAVDPRTTVTPQRFIVFEESSWGVEGKTGPA